MSHLERLIDAANELDLPELLGEVEMDLWTYMPIRLGDDKPGYVTLLSIQTEDGTTYEKMITVTHLDILKNKEPGQLAAFVKGKIEQALLELKEAQDEED